MLSPEEKKALVEITTEAVNTAVHICYEGIYIMLDGILKQEAEGKITKDQILPCFAIGLKMMADSDKKEAKQ